MPRQCSAGGPGGGAAGSARVLPAYLGKPMPIMVRVPRSGYAQAALILLLVCAFGGLTVGGMLLLIPAALTSWVPITFFAYGLASLAGAIGVWRMQGWALPVVVVFQGLAAAGLLYANATYAEDWSLLVVAALAVGAAALTVIDAVRRRRGVRARQIP
jgi:hypothetical protein